MSLASCLNCPRMAARTGRAVNVKKGQWMSAEGMGGAVEKVKSGGATGVAVGAAKEVFDAANSGEHTCSFQDFAVTSAGAFVGAYTAGRWAINVRAKEARITYSLKMNLDRLGE